MLGVCTRLRNEGRYLREWIEFHRLVGVSAFYIFDDGSTDDTAAVLAPCVESRGRVACLFVFLDVCVSGLRVSGSPCETGVWNTITSGGGWVNSSRTRCSPPHCHRRYVRDNIVWLVSMGGDPDGTADNNATRGAGGVGAALRAHDSAHGAHGFRDECLRRNPLRVRWLLNIDVDEFVFPRPPPRWRPPAADASEAEASAARQLGGRSDKKKEKVVEWEPRGALARHVRENCRQDVSHFKVRWRIFGSSGLVHAPPDALVIESFVHHGKTVAAAGMRGDRDGAGCEADALLCKKQMLYPKLLVNTRCTRSVATHFVVATCGGDACGELYEGHDDKHETMANGRSRKSPTESPTEETLYLMNHSLTVKRDAKSHAAHARCAGPAALSLNHYAVKSRDEFVEKFARGRISTRRREQQEGLLQYDATSGSFERPELPEVALRHFFEMEAPSSPKELNKLKRSAWNLIAIDAAISRGDDPEGGDQRVGSYDGATAPSSLPRSHGSHAGSSSETFRDAASARDAHNKWKAANRAMAAAGLDSAPLQLMMYEFFKRDLNDVYDGAIYAYATALRERIDSLDTNDLGGRGEAPRLAGAANNDDNVDGDVDGDGERDKDENDGRDDANAGTNEQDESGSALLARQRARASSSDASTTAALKVATASSASWFERLDVLANAAESHNSGGFGGGGYFAHDEQCLGHRVALRRPHRSAGDGDDVTRPLLSLPPGVAPPALRPYRGVPLAPRVDAAESALSTTSADESFRSGGDGRFHAPTVPMWIASPPNVSSLHRFFDSSPFSPSGRYLAYTRMERDAEPLVDGDRAPHGGGGARARDGAGEEGDEDAQLASVVVLSLVTGEERVVARTRGADSQVCRSLGGRVAAIPHGCMTSSSAVEMSRSETVSSQLPPLTALRFSLSSLFPLALSFSCRSAHTCSGAQAMRHSCSTISR